MSEIPRCGNLARACGLLDSNEMRLAVWLLCVGLMAACNHRPCSLSIDHVFPGPIDYLEIVKSNPLVLFAKSYDGVGWYTLDDTGRIDRVMAVAPDGLEAGLVWLDFIHTAIPRNAGFRVITDHRAAYIDPWSGPRQVDLTPASTVTPNKFSVERVWNVEGLLYCVWSAIESTAPSETWIAGLGQINSNDQVLAIGAPFYRGPAPQGIVGLRFFGGWDSDGYFWVDQPDKQHVLQIDRTGAILGTFTIQGNPPYLLHWVKLPSGRWAGQQGSLWSLFTPLDRPTRFDSFVPATGVTTSTTQYLDSLGRLWIAGPTTNEIVVRLWDDATSTMGDKVDSPVSVGHCDSEVYLRP